MRKMFSKNQIKELAVEGVNEGISSGSVEVGTKLYLHNAYDNNGDFHIIFISTNGESSGSSEESLGAVLEGCISIIALFDNTYGAGSQCGVMFDTDMTLLYCYDIEDEQLITIPLTAAITWEDDEVTPL